MLFSRKDKNQKETERPIEQPLIYQGNGFTIKQPEGWQDKTIHTLLGPIKSDVQHNIIITVEENVTCNSVSDYADIQITALEQQLMGCHLLKREEITLANGKPAYKVIFRWDPSDQFPIYQEQVFVLNDGKAYKITTSFSRKTRKTMGPEIDRIIMSFQNM